MINKPINMRDWSMFKREPDGPPLLDENRKRLLAELILSPAQ
jgi:hypothetical protein